MVDDFQTTNHTPEALARLTEIYLKMGLVSEAKRTASVLSYNYPGSPWYQDSWNELVDVGAVQGQASLANTPGHPGFFSRAWGWVF